MSSIHSDDNLTEQILFAIRDSKESLSFRQLCKQFDICEDYLLKEIMKIKSWGYEIFHSFDRIEFIAAPNSLIDTEIKYKLETKYIGKKIFTYQETKSTNDIASNYACSGEDEGVVIIAESQSQGRGRLGRVWHSPPLKGAYISIILKPDFESEFAPAVSILAALSLAEAVKEFTDEKVQIKWPNDVLINGKKTGGILTELSADNKKINHIIVGIGININQTTDDFPNELKEIATSLAIESKKEINRSELIKRFLTHFEIEYEYYKKDKKLTQIDRIRSLSSLIGKEITLSFGKNQITGKAVDIDSNGALLVLDDEKTHVINSGEVTIVKK